MSLHFKTEAEANLDRYARISPSVLAAIETNKEAFMDLLGKIFEDTKDELIQVSLPEPEEGELPIDPAVLDQVKRLVLATYLVSFLVQDIPFVADTLGNAHQEGVEDGYAYVQVKRMRRN